jgi:hypothetical protein
MSAFVCGGAQASMIGVAPCAQEQDTGNDIQIQTGC